MLLTNYATGQASSLPSTGKKFFTAGLQRFFFKYRCYLVVEPVQRYSLFLSLSLCFCGASCHYLGDHQNPATRLLSLALSRVCVRERERERQKRRASKVRAGDPRQSLGGGASFFLCFALLGFALRRRANKADRAARAVERERERGRSRGKARRCPCLVTVAPGSASSSPSLPALRRIALVASLRALGLESRDIPRFLPPGRRSLAPTASTLRCLAWLRGPRPPCALLVLTRRPEVLVLGVLPVDEAAAVVAAVSE
jgi:hypothetical protein